MASAIHDIHGTPRPDIDRFLQQHTLSHWLIEEMKSIRLAQAAFGLATLMLMLVNLCFLIWAVFS